MSWPPEKNNSALRCAQKGRHFWKEGRSSRQTEGRSVPESHTLYIGALWCSNERREWTPYIYRCTLPRLGRHSQNLSRLPVLRTKHHQFRPLCELPRQAAGRRQFPPRGVESGLAVRGVATEEATVLVPAAGNGVQVKNCSLPSNGAFTLTVLPLAGSHLSAHGRKGGGQPCLAPSGKEIFFQKRRHLSAAAEYNLLLENSPNKPLLGLYFSSL